LCWCEVQACYLRNRATIELLRKRTFYCFRAKACFYVRERRLTIERCKTRRESRRSVTLGDNEVGIHFFDDCVELLKYRGGQISERLRLAHDSEIPFGFYPEAIEDLLEHFF